MKPAGILLRRLHKSPCDSASLSSKLFMLTLSHTSLWEVSQQCWAAGSFRAKSTTILKGTVYPTWSFHTSRCRLSSTFSNSRHHFTDGKNSTQWTYGSHGLRRNKATVEKLNMSSNCSCSVIRASKSCGSPIELDVNTTFLANISTL